MNVSIIKETSGFNIDVFYNGPLGRTYTLEVWREETKGAAYTVNTYPFTPGFSYPGFVKHLFQISRLRRYRTALNFIY
jgi:allophanate hydrolase subunit 1